MTPTKQQIEEAKAYIRNRVDAELSAYRLVDKFMDKAVMEIIAISYKYGNPMNFKFSNNRNMDAETDKVLEELKDNIRDVVYYFAVPEEDKREDVLAYINEEKYGSTFKKRLDTHMGRFKKELEVGVMAGLMLGWSADKLYKSIKENYSKPYANPLFKEASKVDARFKAVGYSYGVGRTNAMHTALQNLVRSAVSDGWMFSLYLNNPDSSTFFSMRGSSFPCSLCDDMVGEHPISEYYGAWHGKCKCIFIFM